MTLPRETPLASQTQAAAFTEAWSTPSVTCVLVPRGVQTDVELRNADGVAFLRKTAPDGQSAKNEAAILRLFLDERRRSHRVHRGLRPFVLIVADDAESRASLAEVMRAFGVRALAMGLGREAVNFAQELTPDLILLDHTLPDATGSEICRQIRGNPLTAGIPIVIVTASPESVPGAAPSEAPDVVLAKPCGFDTILTTSRLLLRDVLDVAVAGGV
jgi:CheY-like chemotaxis protein